MASKQGKSGSGARGLPRDYPPTRSAAIWLLTRYVHYLFYIGVAIFAFVARSWFAWPAGVISIMVIAWLVLVGLMIRVDTGKIVAAQATRRGLRVRYFWGWQEFDWDKVRGFLFKRPEDRKLVVVKVVPRHADGRLPRFSVLVLTNNRHLRLDLRSIQNMGDLLETVAEHLPKQRREP